MESPYAAARRRKKIDLHCAVAPLREILCGA
jgi:hypothetical protein